MADSLRVDARNNRDQILAAARILFGERGIDVPMKEIADRAGVGVGTLYRRFPDRDSLVAAAARQYLGGLADAVAAARSEEGAAWPALCRVIRECVADGLGAQAAALEPGAHAVLHADAELADARSAIGAALAELTRQAQADGDLRPDVEPRDVALTLTVQVYVRPDESRDEAVRRIVAIIVNGLRARP